MNMQNKYEIILSYEKKTAFNVTSQIVEKPEISPWMFLIPIIFIPHLQRLQKYKHAVKAFSDGYLFTKQLALDVAFAMYKEHESKERALSKAETAVKKNPQAPEHIQKIYGAQIAEISLLTDFYYELLRTKGNSYEEMIRELQPTKVLHQDFLNNLALAEAAVNHVAVHAVKVDQSELPELFKKLEEKLKEYRENEATRIYNC